MRKRPSTAPAASSHPLRLAGALAALLAIGASGAQAATAGSASPQQPVSNNYCLLVKNTAAQADCLSARQAFYNREYGIALVTMRKAQALSPREGLIRAMIGSILVRLGDVGGAERELRQARKDGAPDHIVLPTLLRAMFDRHELVNLLSEFPEPAPNAKDDVAADILYGRAMALDAMGSIAEAATSVNRSLSLRRDVTSLLLRAKIAIEQNDLPLARKLTDEAYHLAPTYPLVLLAKLQQSERSNDAGATLAIADQFLKVVPNSSDAREARIRVFLKQNQDAKAQAEVDAILAKSPVPVGIFYKAVLLARAHDKKGAAQTIQALPPEFVKGRPEFALQMAQIAFDNGNTETGAAILGASLSVAPNALDLRLRLASLRLSQNSPQSALQVLEPVKDSRDPRVQKLLGDVRARIVKDRAF